VTIGFIGGTGPEGLGLAMRTALAGHAVCVGSRDAARAAAAAMKVADALTALGHECTATGLTNLDAAAQSDIVVIVVPYSAHAVTLPTLRDATAGKIVIDVAVPLTFADGYPNVDPVPEGSATEQAQALLPDARVVGAFHNLSARKLQNLDTSMTGDVLITGDDLDAKQTVIDLANSVHDLRGVDAGPLALSKCVEDITALLLGINQRNKANTAIQIVGL
jgi:NADPH-dependent F420 reductase